MIKNIDINKIFPHPENPRKEIGDITELADSIKAKGILQNLTIIPRSQVEPEKASLDEYTVIIGHRRLAAAKRAGVFEVPCTVTDMDPREQIETMLLENIQREDLTIYEQAMGFKSLFEMGVSVKEISKRSGFGETSIRRRLKLGELDKERLKRYGGVQIKMDELDRLNKIESVEERNGILETLGTNNFEWRVSAALRDQERRKREPAFIKVLETFAKKIERSEIYGYYDNVKSYCIDTDEPEDIEVLKGEYFYAKSYNGFDVYKKSQRPEKKNDLQAAITKERIKKLEDIAELCKNSRRTFIDNFCGYNKTEDCLKFAVNVFARASYTNVKNIREMLGVCGVDENKAGYADITDDEMAKIGTMGKNDVLVRIAFSAMENMTNKAHTSYDGKYSEYSGERLKRNYKALEILGYEPSDEEIEYINGTHDAYANREE